MHASLEAGTRDLAGNHRVIGFDLVPARPSSGGLFLGKQVRFAVRTNTREIGPVVTALMTAAFAGYHLDSPPSSR